MRIRFDIPNDVQVLEGLLFGLCIVDAVMIVKYEIPPLYESGVVYRREPPRREDWWNVLQILGRGYGDCEDLTCWRVAELRAQGESARPRIVSGGRHVLHAVVERGDGTIEDPSRMLGMGRRKR